MARSRRSDDELFRVRKVGDGIHMAVAAHAYRVNCNAAIIETGDGVAIVDSHSKPSAARALVRLVGDLTRQPVRYLVNTHFHWDHWQGNEVYPAAYPQVEVITSRITREAMVKRSLKRIQDHLRAGPAELAGLRAALAAAGSADERAEARSRLRQAEAYLAEIQDLRPTLPTMAFEDALRIVRGDREIHLRYLGRAHTEGDVFVHLPKEQIVATGDAVIGWTPFMGDGYPEDWVATLDRLAQLDFTTMMMGHGDLVGRDWLALFRGYIADLVEAVRREATAGASLDEARQRVPDRLAARYEVPLSRFGGSYRPWRTLVLANIERVYQLVS
jgi:glyoxylase-like metal-dependent hydrolase (beta-lactamase superfamily II)